MSNTTPTKEATMNSDTWIVNGEWIAPGRTAEEAIEYLHRCGIQLEEANFVCRMDA